MIGSIASSVSHLILLAEFEGEMTSASPRAHRSDAGLEQYRSQLVDDFIVFLTTSSLPRGGSIIGPIVGGKR
jgi:hypothetical protein